MVCAECGSNQFEQTRTARIEYTMVFEHGQWLDVSDAVVDGGDRDTEIFCSDCGVEVEDDDLVTVEQYDLALESEW